MKNCNSSEVQKTISQYAMLNPGDHVLIGLSGGADSVCLTHILSNLRPCINIEISAIYINHNIREAFITAKEERFVKDICAALDIRCKIESVNVLDYAAKNHMSAEEAGRVLRREIFCDFDCDKVALAHHADDVAETVLLNLFRGTGIKGTAGISPVTFINDRLFIRPLYALYRADIETYIAENKLSYCLDQTNLGNDYTRNRIRNSILPMAKDGVCAAANRNVFAYARRMRLLADYIENESEKYFSGYVVKTEKGYRIPDIVYKEIHAALQPEIILYTIGKLNPNMKNIGEIHLKDILSLYEKGRGKYLCLPAKLRAMRVTGGVELYISSS